MGSLKCWDQTETVLHSFSTRIAVVKQKIYSCQVWCGACGVEQETERRCGIAFRHVSLLWHSFMSTWFQQDGIPIYFWYVKVGHGRVYAYQNERSPIRVQNNSLRNGVYSKSHTIFSTCAWESNGWLWHGCRWYPSTDRSAGSIGVISQRQNSDITFEEATGTYVVLCRWTSGENEEEQDT